VPARHEGLSFVTQVFVRLEAGRAEGDALARRPKYEGALHADVVVRLAGQGIEIQIARDSLEVDPLPDGSEPV
jgi:hypothetical protein